ncbi:APA family fibronectin-binding glycoprotein [Actinoplanes sp. L3-i22]|uniref:DUF3152 domain-containing protein n=1 Tax=Actinoplanes sp. L3-i22 TaxID=2836373 RepID=UPI001C77A42F|nr:APA family fibronectin-binding glycoprotein [Actinoplanes sp. L3-i22]BCY05474.1 hypothetical protein L3i22_005620 [Actinoplanes sp. L3-i22]
MIAPVTPVHEPDTQPPAGDRWRQWWLALFAVTLVLLAVIAVASQRPAPTAAPVSDSAPVPSASATPTPSAPSATPSPSASTPILESASASPSAPTSLVDPELLQIPGVVPTHASGDFAYAVKRGSILGRKGQLKRFRVAVEKGSGEDPDAFAAQVVSTLGDDRGWVGNGTLRLLMVNGDERADFTVYLATRDTAGAMCQAGGTNIRIGGVPYTSCRATGKAIINLDRYRKSSKPYLNAKIPLAVYRNYVINHEVGHELGHHHEGCPKSGGPAPVMVQQTLTTRGCVPYAWPRLHDKAFSGPAL